MDYDYSFLKKRSKKQPNRIMPIAIIIVLILFVFISKRLASTPSMIEPIVSTPIIKPRAKLQNQDQLMEKIQEIIKNKPGTYSIFISDFSTNGSFGINENTIFTAASINKIPILATLYYYAQKREIDLDRDITIQPQDIQEGTGPIQYDPPKSVYSYKTLARLMMEKSDNTAAYLLANQILTMEKIQDFINKMGLTQTDMKLNKTSNTDQEKILRAIYENKITDHAYTAEMLDFLKNSDFEDRLPAYLPKTVPVYHKIGSEIRNTHDVGIINLPNHPYYLGVFTSDNPSEEDSVKIIAEISKIVFEYFSSQKN